MGTGIAVAIALGFRLLIRRTKPNKKLKKFLILTGVSIVGFFIFTILHNVISGLLEIEEPIFFILATLVCPIGLIVGLIGSVIQVVKRGR